MRIAGWGGMGEEEGKGEGDGEGDGGSGRGRVVVRWAGNSPFLVCLNSI